MSSKSDRFKKMVEDSQDWFWEFDENANFTYASPRIKDLLGYEPEEILGLNAFDLMSPEEAKRVRNHFDPIAKKYLPFTNLENVNLHKDGHEVVIESSGTPIFDQEGRFRGYRGIDRDITQRKTTEQALRDSQALLKETKKIAKLGSWHFDVVNNHLWWSDETHRIFGVEKENFTPSYASFLEAVHPEDRSKVDLAYKLSLKNCHAGYEIEHRIIKKDSGEIRYVHEKCKHEYNSQGEIIRSIGMVQDITDRKATELALLAATQAAESSKEAKSLFLAKVSHEIRTPLTAIIGYGELMENTELSSVQANYLETINSSGSALLTLINDILNLSKIETGKVAIKKNTFKIRKLISNLARLQQPYIAAKNLSLNVEIKPDVPDELVGDPLRIEQVVLNLLANAIKFTESGSIDIEVSVQEDSFNSVLLNITVKDSGIGISKGEQDDIFKPFFRSSGAIDKGITGTGLGLAISQSLAGLMGGTLSLESLKGFGSQFHLLIPLQKKTESHTDKPVEKKKIPPWEGATLNLLLAEDNPANAYFIKVVLENMGHVVTIVENGLVALEFLKSKDYDLMLMDIDMPLMDGVTAIKVFREMEQLTRQHMPVVALTAYALVGDREKYLDMGFDGYLCKPLKTKELIEELQRVLDE